MLELLGELWKRFPDQRLGQLVFNAVRTQYPPIEDVFDIEDNSLKEGIARLLGEDGPEN
ncbi:hypothetical protein ACSFA8_26815 [Variovorax sp. RT4R15]|uniref:hypothetical protein n=1 Tax=Variovorax sp. RT4R15 TaxID=3443737 RepID=UPI003F471DE0